MNFTNADLPLFTIGTVARLLNVSVQTLRLYEQRGLILITKSAGNQRLYTKSDIERLRCIRTAITVEKLSLEGIRRIHSLIPCWAYKQCPMEQRESCPAYREHESGCWNYCHQSNVCAENDCRECRVYQLSIDCNQIKTMIRDQFSNASPQLNRIHQESKETMI